MSKRQKSVDNLKDFEQQIELAQEGSSDAEEWIREIIFGAAEKAPLGTIVELCKVLVKIRKSELDIIQN